MHRNPRLLDLTHFSILFEGPSLCIARCDACGRWLVNDGSRWEPLLQQERLTAARDNC
ncbi:hypothetical protein GCM10011348_00540 [Marinobacterium nitratireducens]|uniref:Uncharacterized protein n=1 Tax=Marinobacterium nitratireducens TaxID=518897 RepID=A0A917Z5R3_9GAMM|nr:hypothetical protein [Marinobacterium nitratireducens]GGO75531.1 hypothetical protein GCM10011348_00540 [Marinobacterium nitratireducens]